MGDGYIREREEQMDGVETFNRRNALICRESLALRAKAASALAMFHPDDRVIADLIAIENANDTVFLAQRTFAWRRIYVSTLEELSNCSAAHGLRLAPQAAA